MKFHNNSFGRREKKTVFLSFLAAATVFQLTSCADHAQIPELPPITEDITLSDTELPFSNHVSTETTAFAQTTTESQMTTETQTMSPVPDALDTETESKTQESFSIRTEKTEEIIVEPYETKYEYSYFYPKGAKIEKQKGQNGEIRMTTITTYEGDTVLDVSTQKEILSERIDALVIIGMQVVTSQQKITQTGDIVAFETRYLYDDALYEDEKQVVTAGKNGYTLYTYLVTYENNREVSRTLFSQSVFPPVAEEIRVGTKPCQSEELQTVKENIIAYTTRYEYDDTLESGVRKLKTKGADGYTEKVYQVTYYKGEESSRKVISEKTVAPIEEVIVVGTKKEETYYMPFYDAAHGGYDYPLTQSFSSSHRALDFGIWYGEPIRAIKGGTVIAAYNEGHFSKDNILWTYGTYVVIEHEDGMRSYYAHLKSKTVSVGQKVSGGQVIGYCGNTGRVNPAPTTENPLAGTHLHFEIRVKQNGAYVTVDPRKYLPYWN